MATMKKLGMKASVGGISMSTPELPQWLCLWLRPANIMTIGQAALVFLQAVAGQRVNGDVLHRRKRVVHQQHRG